jgi:hypothetical protein
MGLLVCSDVFEGLAKASAAALGLADMRMVVLPHGLRLQTEDELLRRKVVDSGSEQISGLI